MRLAAASFASDTIFGVGMLVTLEHLARNGQLPMTPWGSGRSAVPFQVLGERRFAAIGSGFVGVCAIDALTGVWLWRGQRRGANLGLATTPVVLFLGAGFALPSLLGPEPVRAAVLIADTRKLC